MKYQLHTLKRNLSIFGMLIVLTSVLGLKGWGQLLVEDFSYTVGTVLTTTATADPTTGWLAHSGNGTQNIDVTSGLSFTGYGGSGIGGAANVDNNGQDINKTFTSQTTGVVYAAVMIQTQATNAAGYFFMFSPTPVASTFYSRVWVNATGNGVGIGTSAPGSYIAITAGTTALLVVKHDFATHISSLFVLNSYAATEPGTADQTFSETATSIGAVALRQYSASQRIIVDGIRVGTTWASVTPSSSAAAPAFTADVTSNTVDNNLDITFTDDPTWRAAVSAVKVGGTALAGGDFTLSAGNLQLKPSNGNSLLTTPGSKAVTVEATGYAVGSVTQIINVGADAKLVMKTQPAAPISNGSPLSTQPEVYIQDQYGNATTSTAAVSAAVGAGSWTLGGTTPVNAVSGTATFSGLTATSAAAVTGATISFTSGSLTGVTSAGFDIPDPSPQIDWCNLQYPATATFSLGGNVDVYAQVYEPGLTPGAGQGAGITAWIGYGTSNTDLSGYTWVLASYNSGVTADNDEYMANIGSTITPPGTYYYASRFQLGVAPYVYGGTSGIWASGQSGTLTITPAPTLDWVNLQSPTSGAINTGGTYNVYAQVYEAGLTNAAGQAAGITSWIGYSTTDTDPSTWTNWIATSYNADFGNNDEYVANIGTALPAGTYYYASRFKYGAADYVYGGLSGFWVAGQSGVLTVSTPEPTNHATAFTASTTAPTISTITLNWTDASPAAENYLIKGSTVSFAAITSPADGTFEADGSLVKNVAAGAQTYTFTGLTPSTTYYFRIFPYNGTGTAVNYKTDGTVPEASEVTLAAPAPTAFRSKTTGNWNATTSWQSSSDETAWYEATSTPTSGMKVYIQVGHTITLTQDEACNDLCLNNSTSGVRLATGNYTLSVNGKLAAYSTAVDVFPVTVSSTVGNTSITSAAGVGKIKFVGTTRTLTTTGEWGNNPPNWDVEFAPTAGEVLTIQTGFKAANITVSSGTLVSSSVDFRPDGNATGSGSITVKSGAKLQFSNTGAIAIKRVGTASATSHFANFTVESGATLEFSGNPVIGTAAFNFAGTVIYSGAAQTLASKGANSAGVDLNAYNALELSGTGIKTIVGNTSVITSLISGAGNTLAIPASTSLTIAPTCQATVSGTLTNAVGTGGLVIKSDATGTGSLITATSVPATVERYLTPSVWHLISSPVSAQSIPTLVGASPFATNGDKVGIAPYDNTVPNWVPYTASTTLPTAGDFITAKGYEAMLTSGSALSFKGNLVTTDQTIAATTSANNWNVVGNPFSSAIYAVNAANDFLSANTAVFNTGYEALYIWNSAGGTYTILNNLTTPSYIPLGQSFFINAVDGGGSVNFNAAMRTHSAAAYNKSGQNTYPVIDLKATVADKNRSTQVYFVPGTTAGIDGGYDAGMFGAGNSDVAIYTAIAGSKVDFALQSLPESYDNLVIPVGLNAPQGSVVNFTADVMNLPGSVMIYLEDKATGTFTRLDESGSAYRITLAAASSGTGRFYLHTSDMTVGNNPLTENVYTIIPQQNQHKILVLGKITSPATAMIYDLSGRLMGTTTLHSGMENEITFAPATNGIYLLKIQNGSTIINRKINWVK